jgi:hypothetical protein
VEGAEPGEGTIFEAAMVGVCGADFDAEVLTTRPSSDEAFSPPLVDENDPDANIAATFPPLLPSLDPFETPSFSFPLLVVSGSLAAFVVDTGFFSVGAVMVTEALDGGRENQDWLGAFEAEDA